MGHLESAGRPRRDRSIYIQLILIILVSVSTSFSFPISTLDEYKLASYLLCYVRNSHLLTRLDLLGSVIRIDYNTQLA